MGDQGDLDFQNVKATGRDRDAGHGSLKRQELVGHANRLIYEAVGAHCRNGALALTLGGDHSIGVGSVAGALKARPETAVLWVDAHADINSPKVGFVCFGLCCCRSYHETQLLLALTHDTKNTPRHRRR